MNIFNIFGKQTPKPQITEVETKPSYSTFSTPLGQIGKGDLTAPYIRSYSSGEQYVRYGNDNLFPQILNQLAIQSGLHGSILKFKANAIIGGGFELTSPDKSAEAKIKEYAFLHKNKFKKMMRELTDDLLIHGRVHILVKQGPMGNVCLKRVGPEKIRVSEDRCTLAYSYDWSRHTGQKFYPEYYDGCMEDSIYSYYINSPGGDIYPYVTYQGCLNWVFLSSEIPFLQKDFIQNAIYPSYVITTAGKFKSEMEMEEFRKTIKILTEPSKRGKALVFANQNLEALPKIEAMPMLETPKMFDTLMKDVSENIAIAHQINPAIMGVKVTGQLGNTTEIEDSYKIFEKNFIIPTREEIEYIANDLLAIGDINATLTITNLQIIDDEIVNVKKQII